MTFLVVLQHVLHHALFRLGVSLLVLTDHLDVLDLQVLVIILIGL